MSGEVPERYFQAFAPSDKEGTALYNLHQSRVQWARNQAQHADPQVDGG